jgi:phage gpG-like protein
MSPDAAVAALASVARSLRALSQVPSQFAKESASSLQEVIEAQFANEQDPYGRPWTPLKPSTVKRKGGDTRILRETDRMLDSLQIKPMSGAGLSITLDPPYAAFHQVGTKDMPARPILPRAGLPDTWRRALADAEDRVFERWAEKAVR